VQKLQRPHFLLRVSLLCGAVSASRKRSAHIPNAYISFHVARVVCRFLIFAAGASSGLFRVALVFART
jgi:hypothetical protein